MAKTQSVATEQGKGGGPNTVAGKTVVARNPVSHGITSPNPVMLRRGAEADPRKAGPEAHQHVIRRAAEPNDANVYAPVHAAH